MSDRTPGIRPRPTLARRLDVAARVSVPAATTALLMVVAGAPLGLPGQAVVQVSLALICVFFWSLFRPASMTPVIVFGLGVFADLLQFSPAGVDILLLLAAHGIARRWRRRLARQGFLTVWLVFVGVAWLTAALGWALTSVLTLHLYPVYAVVLQAGVSSGLYPALALLLTPLHRTAAEPGLA